MKSSNIDEIWCASKYNLNSSAQLWAAINLLKSLDLDEDDHILDVGCGDGKISALISKMVSMGRVHGVDKSPQMISYAKSSFPQEKFANLFFSIQDAQYLKCNEKFNVIFSSFALQWLKNPCSFFSNSRNFLYNDGYLAMTIPLDISDALEESIKKINHMPQWSPYFKSFIPGWHFKSHDYYYEKIHKHRFDIINSLIENQKIIFDNRDELESYVAQWFTYLLAIPKELHSLYLKNIIDEFLVFNPPISKSGNIEFIFRRFDFVAKMI